MEKPYFVFPSPKVPSHVVAKKSTIPSTPQPPASVVKQLGLTPSTNGRRQSTVITTPINRQSMKTSLVQDENCNYGNNNNGMNSNLGQSAKKESYKKIFTPKKVDPVDIELIEEQLKQFDLTAASTTTPTTTTTPTKSKAEQEDDDDDYYYFDRKKNVGTGLDGRMNFKSKDLDEYLEEHLFQSLDFTAQQKRAIHSVLHSFFNHHSTIHDSFTPDAQYDNADYADDYDQNTDDKHVETSQQGTPENEIIDLTNSFAHPSTADRSRMVVKSIQGTFATALTPVRVPKKKQVELGTKYAVSPVKRSTRTMSALSNGKDANGGGGGGGKFNEADSQQLVEKLLDDYGYAFVPNAFLRD